ncbi:MAG: hypothetical protein D6775_13670 [Caldilineae bacterium]|nr:MAG: hypothetical protein D6775_13670 [Caldilineae bacterium]
MRKSIEFEWKEGSELPETAAHMPATPAAAPPDIPPYTAAEEKGWRLWSASNLALLMVGIILGVVLGFAILTVQGQWRARNDMAPVVALQYQALARNDVDLYRELADPTDVLWRDLLAQRFPSSRLLYDLHQAPRVRRVQLQGNQAEVEVEYVYQGERYRYLQSLRLIREQWHLSRARLGAWGEQRTLEGEYVTLRYRERDAFLADYLPRMDAAAQAFCRRYAPPPPCHVDLRIEPEPDLLPFAPGEGASPPPTLTRYRIIGQGDTHLVTLNSTGEEFADPEFQTFLLGLLPGIDDINRVYPAKYATADAQTLSAMRLYQRQMPLELVSPRLVGVSSGRPHPLWLLALYESIGDVVVRRALGPFSHGDVVAFSLWAALRGDVALRAEELSGVVLADLPQVRTSISPSDIGERLVMGDVTMRNAAREFARLLEDRYGRDAVLRLLQAARANDGVGDVFSTLGTTADELAGEAF